MASKRFFMQLECNSFLLLIWLWFLVCSKLCIAQGPTSVGCCQDNLDDPAFVDSPGGYDPNLMNPSACSSACKANEYYYAGIQDGNFCFCANIKDKCTAATDANCDAQCSDNSTTAMCGGSNGLTSVYEAQTGVELSGLNLVASADVVNVMEEITFTITLASGKDVKFRMDYGDGPLISMQNTTGMIKHKYPIPGEYVASVYASDDYNPSVSISSTVAITVHPIMGQNIMVDCPKLADPNEEILCNVTLIKGPAVEMTISKGNGFSTETYSLPETQYGTLGNDVPQVESADMQTVTVDNVILMPGTIMDTEGYIVGLEAYVSKTGTIDFLVMSPSCTSGTFCYSTGQCEATCSSPADEVSCTSPNVFHPLSQSCDAGVASKPYNAQTFVQRDKYTASASALGYLYVDLEELSKVIKVFPGDVFAIQLSGGAEVASHNATTAELASGHGDKSAPSTSGPWTSTVYSHFARAIVTRPSTATLRYSYNSTGNYTVLVTCTDPVTASSETNSTVVVVAVGIGAVNLTVEPLEWATNVPVNFTTTVINGSDFYVLWDFGDGSSEEIHEPSMVTEKEYPKQHTYTKDGVYAVSVRAYNFLDNETDSAEVVIQYPVTSEWTVTSNSPQLFPSGIVNFTLDYPAGLLPTNATAMITWRDGSSSDTVTIPNGSTTANTVIPFSHPFQKGGTINVTIFISNLVSNYTLENQVILYEKIEGLSAAISYLSDQTGSAPKPAAGANKNLVPANSNVTLYMTSVRGDILGYCVYKDDGTLIQNTTTSPIYYAVTNEGIYNLTIYAWNTLQSQSDPAYVSIQVQKIMSGLEIDDFFVTTAENETKLFEINIGTLGTDLCMLVSYNDSKDQLPDAYGDVTTCLQNYSEYDFNYIKTLETTMNVSHVFKTKGVYSINVLVFNAISVSNSSMIFTVTNFPCPKPTVRITDAKTVFAEATKYERSKAISLEAKAQINCTCNVTSRKQWYIYTTDDKYGLEATAINISKIASNNKSILYISPLFLPYGNYKVVYVLSILTDKMDPKLPWKRSLYTYIKVVPSPLVAVMIEGAVSKVIRGPGQKLNLDVASYSTDPDNPTDNNFNISWLCRRVAPVNESFAMNGDQYDLSKTIQVPEPNGTKPSSDGGGCFGTGQGALNLSTGSWNVDTQIFFAPQMTFEIVVLVSKESRKAEARLQLELVDGMPPSIVIRCMNEEICFPMSNGILINPTTRLGVTGHCIQDCVEPLTYHWSVNQASGTEVTEARNYMIGGDRDEMAISTGFFGNHSGPSSFHLELEVVDANGLMGNSLLFLNINRPPTNGYCSVTPTSGRALLDNFKVSCSEWTDPENDDLSYTFSALVNGSSIPAILSSGTEKSSTVVLAYGDVQLEVEVIDKWGASTVVDIDIIQTTLPSKEDFEAFLNSSYISNLVGGGDQEKICQVFQAIASIQDSGLLAPPSQSGSDNSTEADEQQIVYADRISNFLDGLTTLTAGNLKDIEMISSTTSSVVGSGDNLDSRGKQKSVSILEQLGNILNENVTFRSPQEVKEYATSALSIMSAITNSISDTIIDDVILPSDMAHIDEIEYDTDIGDDADFEMPTDTNTMHRQAIKSDTSYNAMSQVQKITRQFNQLSKKVLSQLVPSEEPIHIEANGLTAMIGKFFQNDVNKQEFDLGDAMFKLPSFCTIIHRDVGCDLMNESVGIQAVTWPTILYAYAKNVHHLANNTKTVQIELYNDTDGEEKMIVQNLSVPVDIFIPRTSLNGTIVLPEPVEVNVSLKWNEFMMYHQFNVTKPGSAVNVEISGVDNSALLLVFLRYEKKPTIFNYDSVIRMSDLRVINDTYDYFISSLDIGNKTGIFYLGIAEVYNESSYVVLGNFTQEMLLHNFTTSYSLRIFTSGCYFYDELADTWVGRNCWVSNSNHSMTHCQCNHLTTFGSGFFVMPNTVDFSYVFAHASFNDNLTIYVTLILTFVIFILMAIWAHRKDRKDLQKLGAAPLPDNMPQDKYLYEILLVTGSKQNASTDSKVYFILSGDDDETEARRFGDDKRKIFRKGETDVFIMAVPRSLGSLNYMRIWHDNSGVGHNASWYLSFVVVRDVQTGDKFEFIANCWFAVEEGDGCIDHLLPVAGKEQLTEFSHLFTNTSQRNIADGHLWFSVFLRPPRSRFTRLQRVGCCVAFLYLSMLVNAMWYGTTNSNSSAFKIGPFAISTEQIGVGIMSNLIVFPPSFIIVFFFRKARLRKLRPSRIEEALKRQRMKDKKEEQEQVKAKESSCHGSKQELLKNDVLQQQHQQSNGDTGVHLKKKKKFTLPWIFRYIAWILVFACIGVSVFFIWAYGITFGNEKSKKWVTSLIISFFASILITEPIKLFLMALFFSAVCKNSDDDEDDADEDEEDPFLSHDEEYLHGKPRPVGRTKYHPPNSEALQKARELRLKEIKMWAILREIFGYLLFLFVLIIVSYGNRDPNAYYLRNTLYRAFIREGKDNDFTSLGSPEDYWNWARAALVPNLRAQNLYNDKPPFGFKGFLNDQVNRLMGYAIMRQIRIKQGACKAPKTVMNLTRCSGAFTDFFDEDHNSYSVGWNETVSEDEPVTDIIQEAFRYRTPESLDGYPYVGKLDVYGGGGYVVKLTGRTSDLVQQLSNLEESGWIDRFTRAVLVEFSVYNTQVNLFGVCVIQMEFVPGGGFFQDYRFDGIRLLQYHNGFGLVILICEVAFVAFTLYFSIREVLELCREGRKWFACYWNYAEVVIVLISYTAIVTYVFRKVYTDDALAKFNATKGNGYVNLQYVYMLDQLFGGFIAFVVFLAMLKFIKLLRFNKRMGILSSTLANAWGELSVFAICFLIVFFAFAQLFYLMMASVSADFASFMKTVEYTFSMMLNKFNFNEISMGAPILGPMAFFIFALMTNIVLINLFLTIVISSFEDVAHNIFKQPNEYEIVDFIVKRFAGFLGFSNGPGYAPPTYSPATPQPASNPPSSPQVPSGNAAPHQDDKGDPNVKELPEKVDCLLGYINEVYFDGKIDLGDEERVKQGFAKKRKVVVDGF